MIAACNPNRRQGLRHLEILSSFESSQSQNSHFRASQLPIMWCLPRSLSVNACIVHGLYHVSLAYM